MVDGLPADVRSWARRLAARVGIDEPSALSFTAQAWAEHPEQWKAVAHHWCVNQRRNESGRTGGDHRPLLVLDDPDWADDGCDDPALEVAEVRCDLVALVAGLDDTELAALARHYWLGLPTGHNTPAAVACARAMRHARARATPPGTLTAREREVLGLAADGLTMQAIGARLHLSPLTIKSHLSRIARRLGAGNTTHAVALALRAGLI